MNRQWSGNRGNKLKGIRKREGKSVLTNLKDTAILYDFIFSLWLLYMIFF